MFTNYYNISHPMKIEGDPYIRAVVNEYKSDITNLEIQNNTLKISACKTGFMTDELEPRACYNGHRIPATNIYNDPDKRTQRQRAEDLLTYSELRKLATTSINSAEEDIDEFIEILQKLKANKVFRSCKCNDDVKLEEPSEHKDREEDEVSQLGGERITYKKSCPLPPADYSTNVPISHVTDDSQYSF